MKFNLLIIGLLLLTHNVNPQSLTTDNFYTKLIYNTNHCISDCYGIYEFCNPTNTQISYSKLSHSFYGGDVENIKIKKETEINKEYSCITGTHKEKREKEITDNKSGEKSIIEYDITINDYGICNKIIKEYQELEKDKYIQPYECVKIKISGSIGLNNAVDWIPSIFLDKKNYKQEKWAWWNSTKYVYAHEIENFTENYAYALNGTGGFCGDTYYWKAGGGLNYIAKTTTGCTGEFTFVNTTTELAWHNGTCDGFDTANVFPAAVLVQHFDEGGSINYTRDCSGGDHAGQCLGTGDGKCNWTTGLFGKGLEFDGVDDSVNFSTASSILSEGSNFTIEAWVKGDTKADGERILNAYFSDTGLRFEYHTYFAGGDMIFRVASTGAYSNFIFNGSQLGDWMHYVLVWENGTDTTKVYVNGTQVQTRKVGDKAAGTWNYPAGQELFLGAINGASSFFDGTIDEFTIYPTNLSAEEIYQHYLNGVNASIANPKAEESSNTPPNLTSVLASPDTLFPNASISFIPSGQNDSESDTLYYYCSSSVLPTSVNTNCSEGNTGYTSPYVNMNCTFFVENSTGTYTKYCRTYDSFNYSTVRWDSYTVYTTTVTTTMPDGMDRLDLFVTNLNTSIPKILQIMIHVFGLVFILLFIRFIMSNR